MESGDRGELKLLLPSSGESHTRIMGEQLSLRVSSSLMGVVFAAASSAAAVMGEPGGPAIGGVTTVPAAVASLGKSKDSMTVDKVVWPF